MKKIALTVAATAVLALGANAQVLLTSTTPYTQNFNASAAVPTGWAFAEAGSNANSSFISGTGSGTAGDTYFFGTSNEWAFGGLQSGSLTPTVGASFRNNIGNPITQISISYIGETWRVGAASRSDRMDFQYSLNATSLTTGTWVDVNALDYANPGQATGSGSLQHSASLSSTITGLNIASGATIWIRWLSFDASGADDGMAVDNFSLTATAVPEPSTYAMLFTGAGLMVWVLRRKRKTS